MINTYGIQHKTDTAANWASNDPTLLAGELGYESDTGKFKIGDGSTAWSSLSYFQTAAASGADGLGLTWNFDTTTSATPASGDIRFNNATPASVTEVYIHETGAVAAYGREMLQGLKNGDALFIQVVGDTSKYLYFNITSLTDNGGDWTITVDTVLGSGSLPANNDVVSVVPVYLSTGGLSDLVDDTTPQLGGNLDMNGNNIQGVTPTEMGYVSGVTSSIQTQLNAKLANVVEDTTPQLGGNLDAQTNNITNIGNIEVEGHSYADAEVDDGNSSTADTIDWTTGNFHKSTMTGNCTYTFTAPSGATTLILKLVQGGSGSYTATFPATVKWAGGTAPTLSTAVGAVDIVTFYWDGVSYYGTAVLNLS